MVSLLETGQERSHRTICWTGVELSGLNCTLYSRVQANGQDTLDSVRNNVRDNVLHGALNKTWTVPLSKVHGYPIFGQWTVPPDSACITRPA